MCFLATLRKMYALFSCFLYAQKVEERYNDGAF